MELGYKMKYKQSILKPKRWTGEETKALLTALAIRKDFEAPTAQIYYTQLLKDSGIKTSWSTLYRKVRNLKSSFRKAEEWVASTEAKELREKGEQESAYYNSQIRNRCRYYSKLKDIFGDQGFKFYKARKECKKSQKDTDFYRIQSSEPLNYNPQYEISLYSDQYSVPPRQTEENCETNFSEISALLSKSESFQNEPEMIEYEFEARKFEKEIEFRSRKQKIEFEIRKQELKIRRMELVKNETLKTLDIQKDELIARHKLELKYKTDINGLSTFPHENRE